MIYITYTVANGTHIKIRGKDIAGLTQLSESKIPVIYGKNGIKIA